MDDPVQERKACTPIEGREYMLFMYGVRVITVILHRGVPKVIAGTICSTHGNKLGNPDDKTGNYYGIDNVTKTMVHGNEEFEELADGPDDVWERAFRTNDRHILTNREAEPLTNPTLCETWFQGRYTREECETISAGIADRVYMNRT